MVDTTLASTAIHAVHADGRSLLEVNAETDVDACHALVRAMDETWLRAGPQEPAFLSAFLDCAGVRPLFITLSVEGAGVVLLPLEIRDDGTAGFCAGSHANGNFPTGRKESLKALGQLRKASLVSALTNALKETGVEALFLERQLEEMGGIANPFVFSDSLSSPNVALAMSLDGGYEATLSRHNAKRKRKRFRHHQRHLEAAGALSILQPVPGDRVHEVLHKFFDMKATRFRDAGIPDVFADPDVKCMFERLFLASAQADAPTHEMQAVCIDDEPVAVIGCTLNGKRLIVEFGSFDMRHAVAGPGDFLFHLAIRNACERGFEVFDFSIGDEDYKRSWCDIETCHRDTLIPVSAKGQVKSALRILRSHAVRHLKQNRFLWEHAKTARRLAGRLKRN